MNCLICKKGQTASGTATVTLERGGLTLVVKAVPAQVCDNCGEEYVDQTTTAQLLAELDSEARAGSEINVRQFQAA
jgi:YgiT-type zinc finger domain-containing protein